MQKLRDTEGQKNTLSIYLFSHCLENPWIFNPLIVTEVPAIKTTSFACLHVNPMTFTHTNPGQQNVCHMVRIKDGHCEDHESRADQTGGVPRKTANNWCSQYKASQTLFMSLSLSGRPQRELCKVAASIQGTKEDKAELAWGANGKIGIKKREWARESRRGNWSNRGRAREKMLNRPAGPEKNCWERTHQKRIHVFQGSSCVHDWTSCLALPADMMDEALWRFSHAKDRALH